jgi:para-nitrobenzyl esterase
LEELGIKPGKVSQLESLPFAELAAASSRALKRVEAELRAAGERVGAFGLSWGPSVDGNILPHQLFSKEGMLLGKEIPLLIGTVKNEFMPFMNGAYAGASEAKVMDRIKEQHGDRADEFVAAVRSAYPETRVPSDLIDVDVMFRMGAVAQADDKSRIAGGAPVYMYLFTWQSPVMGGKYKAIHCVDVPFAFNTIDRARNMTGGGREAHALADQVSRAWINFARFGNPSQAGLPSWETYTAQKGATMMIDQEWMIRYHPDKAFLDFNRQGSK